ncbi:Holotricin-3 precursor [Phyllobacterium zundukense]|uniref:Holotricin-3 n=1 Tax=Phyllobacterium zundukense TaxID=1867719 RepID=A0ACD4CZ95_9HYPH|nr:Holotricin-3 precursor [Phyllobacterium zundukense]UXN58879.1 Holotricin-3 precursor [Phyllobacterium zundukense]
MVQSKVGIVAAACLGLFFAGAMCATTDHFNPVGSAFAKNGGGNGGGNGNGGGKGNNGGSHGKSSERGNSVNAHDKAKVEKSSLDTDDDKTGLGPLNAAHASARARERAAPNSSVGKIATYERSREEALALTDPALQEEALDDAVAQLETAFGRTLTPAQVDRIDALLDARQ